MSDWYEQELLKTIDAKNKRIEQIEDGLQGHVDCEIDLGKALAKIADLEGWKTRNDVCIKDLADTIVERDTALARVAELEKSNFNNFKLCEITTKERDEALSTIDDMKEDYGENCSQMYMQGKDDGEKEAQSKLRRAVEALTLLKTRWESVGAHLGTSHLIVEEALKGIGKVPADPRDALLDDMSKLINHVAGCRGFPAVSDEQLMKYCNCGYADVSKRYKELKPTSGGRTK